jgi:predicted transglutaminase-like cysteine proteinase
MERINAFAGFGLDRVLHLGVGLALLLTMLLATPSHAQSTNEAALERRLPAAIKVTPLEARSRIRHWQSFVQSTRHKPEIDKIIAVNAYFNTLRFITDETLWRKPDYWATPLQVLVAGAGDCEDFAIAKYFTLKILGIPDERLRITYTWNSNTPSGRREPHMVLTYTAAENAEPLVLDILTNDIRTLAQRKELEPVYGLNSGELWLVGDNTRAIPAGSPMQVSQWRQLSRAMESDAVLLLRKQ